MSLDNVERTVKKLRPEWAQLMANLVLRGWIIKPVEGQIGQYIHGTDAWTAHLECDTLEKLQIATIHKDRFGLRMYSAPSLLVLLEQMVDVLAEFQAIELADLPDAAEAPKPPVTDGHRNRKRKEQYLP